MIDHRRLYINQLIDYYKIYYPNNKTTPYRTIRYKLPDENMVIAIGFAHNEGLEVIAQYIKDLENKLDELQYVEKIIKIAKEN
jgi:hypothetical protein